jgi:hypothetical protein
MSEEPSECESQRDQVSAYGERGTAPEEESDTPQAGIRGHPGSLGRQGVENSHVH